MPEVGVVVAHHERVTLCVGDTYVKIDVDQARLDIEAEAIIAAPVPTPEILWREPNVLALAEVPGRALGPLGGPSAASPAAWSAAGGAARQLHAAPLPPWPGWSAEDFASRLHQECDWLLANEVLAGTLITRHAAIAEVALRPWTPVFTHGDYQTDHVFVDGDEVTGIIDWADAAPGDAAFDLAILTLGHADRLDDVLTGYGEDIDVAVIQGWWSLRSLMAVRWLVEHGFDPSSPLAFLRSH